MDEYKEGELIIYKNGDSYEIGKIKRLTPSGAYVWYSEGETAAKTPYAAMHKIINGYAIKDTALGGSDGEAAAMTWTMAHPILTFILILAALVVLEESVANICKAIIHGKEKEVADNEQAAGKQTGE